MTESIDELVLRVNCTDGTLYCCREFMLNISKTLKHVQKESEIAINDVEVPFEKEIFSALIKFANVSTKTRYSNPELCSNSEKLKKLLLALDWLGSNPELEKSVKERISMLPIQKSIILDPKLLTTAVTHDSSELFEFIAKNGYIVLAEREMQQDFNATSCSYTIFHDIDDVIEYCVDAYRESYEFISPTARGNDRLMMVHEDEECYYLDGYGISDEDYQYLFEQMREKLEEQGRKLDCGRF